MIAQRLLVHCSLFRAQHQVCKCIRESSNQGKKQHSIAARYSSEAGAPSSVARCKVRKSQLPLQCRAHYLAKAATYSESRPHCLLRLKNVEVAAYVQVSDFEALAFHAFTLPLLTPLARVTHYLPSLSVRALLSA